MKTTIAIIRLVLRTNKVLSTGEHPIMLRCSYSGMKEVSTGYSCSIKYWDKKNECCKKSYHNYIMINQELKKLKDEAISRRDRYIANNEVYSPSMILDRSDRFNAVTNDLGGLIQRYIIGRFGFGGIKNPVILLSPGKIIFLKFKNKNLKNEQCNLSSQTTCIGTQVPS